MRQGGGGGEGARKQQSGCNWEIKSQVWLYAGRKPKKKTTESDCSERGFSHDFLREKRALKWLIVGGVVSIGLSQKSVLGANGKTFT